MAEHWFSKDPKEQLAGKTAIIMGGGSGIGKATAELFAAAGANLMIIGVPEQICLDTAAELREGGANAIGMLCDGTKPEQVEAMISKTIEEFGGIDILVSTAGITLPRMNSIEVTEADWDKIFSVNLKANFFLCTAVARVMKDNPDGGKMVVISSQRGISSMENIAPYCITGHRLRALRHPGQRHCPGLRDDPHGGAGLREQPGPAGVRLRSHALQGEDGLARGNGRGHLLPLLAGDHLHHGPDPHLGRRLVHPVALASPGAPLLRAPRPYEFHFSR